MPNRIIKESICSSEDLDKLKPFEEIVFYRLVVNCDDYGRMDARSTVLRSKLFVTRQGITLQNIEDAILKLASVGLVNLYEVDGKPFLLFPKWGLHQRIRNSREKYPAPANDSDIKSFAASCGELPPNPIQSESKSESESESESESNARTREGGIFEGYNFSAEIQAKIIEWLEYKKERKESYRPMGQKNLLTQIQNKHNEFSESQIIFAISESMACNYKGVIWDKIKQCQSQKPQLQQNLTGAEKLRQRMENERKQRDGDIIDI